MRASVPRLLFATQVSVPSGDKLALSFPDGAATTYADLCAAVATDASVRAKFGESTPERAPFLFALKAIQDTFDVDDAHTMRPLVRLHSHFRDMMAKEQAVELLVLARLPDSDDDADEKADTVPVRSGRIDDLFDGPPPELIKVADVDVDVNDDDANDDDANDDDANDSDDDAPPALVVVDDAKDDDGSSAARRDERCSDATGETGADYSDMADESPASRSQRMPASGRRMTVIQGARRQSTVASILAEQRATMGDAEDELFPEFPSDSQRRAAEPEPEAPPATVASSLRAEEVDETRLTGRSSVDRRTVGSLADEIGDDNAEGDEDEDEDDEDDEDDDEDENEDAAAVAEEDDEGRFDVRLLLPNGVSTVLALTKRTSVAALRQRVFQKASVLLVERVSDDFALYLENDQKRQLRRGAIVSKLRFVRECRERGDIPLFIFRPAPAPRAGDGVDGIVSTGSPRLARTSSSRRLSVSRSRSGTVTGAGGRPIVDYGYDDAPEHFDIAALIGTMQINETNDEVISFRRIMRGIRREAWRKARAREWASTPNYDCNVLPLRQVPDKVRLRVQYPGGAVAKTMDVSALMTTDALLEQCHKKFALDGNDPSKYLFKVTGQADYLCGNRPLIEYDRVRRCIKAGLALCSLNIVARDSVMPSEVDDVMLEREELQAEYDTEVRFRAPKHDSIAVGQRPFYSLRHLSMWDVQRKFRIKLTGLHSMPRDSVALNAIRKRLEASPTSVAVLYLTAALVHGGELVAPVARSQVQPYRSHPRWDEWLEFDIRTSDVPQATRVSLTVWVDVVSADDEAILDKSGRLLGGSLTDATRAGLVGGAAAGPPMSPAERKKADKAAKKALKKALKKEAKREAKNSRGEIHPTALVGDGVAVGWVNYQLIDHHGYLRTGPLMLRLWLDAPANPIGTCVENMASPSAVHLYFDEYVLPIVFPATHVEPVTDADAARHVPGPIPSAQNTSRYQNRLDEVLACDPLYDLSEDDKALLWDNRFVLRKQPNALPKVLQSIRWSRREEVLDAQRLLAAWPPMEPMRALELLDAFFACREVREYAVRCLDQLSDKDLSDVILQLTQVIKYEPYHDSALARFVMARALNNTHLIGHLFFWHMKSEMHLLEIAERYGLLLEEYVRGCGAHRVELCKQADVLAKFQAASDKIKTAKVSDAKRLEILRGDLHKLSFEWKFRLPLNPKLEVQHLKVEKCKFMDSKKKPLWLVFDNSDPEPASTLVIFKAGDDLRQDQLTLQLIRLMDRFWQENGLDLRLKPYACISTGDEQGMIEVVLNAETTASITRAAGGFTAAFSQTPMMNWLKQFNQGDDLVRAVDNFCHSCAGYCVATYVLGIGDRHNDNVMLTRDGHLFHIDFGHFLGNFKSFMKLKREKAPFVLTPDFVFVMGGTRGEPFKRFIDLCCEAFIIIRQHAHLFINLFAMMLSTGIPELTSAEDILWLRNALVLDKTDKEARKKFTKLIFQSLHTTTTQINNAVHLAAHRQ